MRLDPLLLVGALLLGNGALRATDSLQADSSQEQVELRQRQTSNSVIWGSAAILLSVGFALTKRFNQ